MEAGLIVIVSFISPYRAERMLARDRVGNGEFLEIFVDTPIEECRRRDPKGLYEKADSGQIRNFTGVDAPYEEPLDPEIRLRTLEGTPDMLADEVVAALRTRGNRCLRAPLTSFPSLSPKPWRAAAARPFCRWVRGPCSAFPPPPGY